MGGQVITSCGVPFELQWLLEHWQCFCQLGGSLGDTLQSHMFQFIQGIAAFSDTHCMWDLPLELICIA